MLETPPQNQEQKRIHNYQEFRPLMERQQHLDELPLVELEELAQDIEALPEYINYLESPLSLRRMEGLLGDFDDAARNADPAMRDKMRQNLATAILNVSGDVRKYYDAILRQENLSAVHRMRMEPWEYREHAQDLDRRRRIVHNELISDLTILTRFVCKAIPERLGVDMPADKVWPSAELSDHNRNTIGEWAYQMEQGKRTGQIHDLILGILEKKRADAA